MDPGTVHRKTREVICTRVPNCQAFLPKQAHFFNLPFTVFNSRTLCSLVREDQESGERAPEEVFQAPKQRVHNRCNSTNTMHAETQ